MANIFSNFKNDFFQNFSFKNFHDGTNKIFQFFHFYLFVWPILFKFQNENFHFKFQKMKIRIFYFSVVVWPIFLKFQKQTFSFQISKLIFFQIFMVL
jgi:hypothetical protein